MQISIALKDFLNIGMIRLPAMAQQRQQLAKVVSHDVLRSPGAGIEHFYNARTIVIAL